MILLTFVRFIIDPFVLNMLMKVVAVSETESSYFRAFLINLVVVVLGMGAYQVAAHYEMAHGHWMVLGVAALLLWPTCTMVFRVSWSRGLIGTGVFFAYCALIACAVTLVREMPMDLESGVEVQFTLGEVEAPWLDNEFWFQGSGEAEALGE